MPRDEAGAIYDLIKPIGKSGDDAESTLHAVNDVFLSSENR